MVKDLNKKISQIAYNCLNLHQRGEARLHSAKQHKVSLPSLARALPEKVMEMTCGLLPKGFDVDKELEQMWEERAK